MYLTFINAAEQSVPEVHRDNALDVGDCRPASQGTACGTYGKHFAQRGFEFFLLSSIVHSNPPVPRRGITHTVGQRHTQQ